MEARPGRDALLTRLVEIMLIEALRWLPPAHGEVASDSGLLAGLLDSRVSMALRLVHGDVERR